jgi:hypothetical protein
MPPRPSPAESATPAQSAADRETRNGLKAEVPGSRSRIRASPPPSDRVRGRDDSSAYPPAPAPPAGPLPIGPRPSTLRELVSVLAASLPPIDLAIDTPLTPAEVVERLPARRRGRKAHKSTVFRWYSSGCRGLRLPFLQVGNQRCTSLRALQAFLDALTAIARFEQGEPVAPCAEAVIARGARPARSPDRQLRVEDELKRRHGI